MITEKTYTSSGIVAVVIAPGNEATAWAQIRQLCPTLTEEGVEVLREGLDGHAKSVLVEPHYVDRDYRNLYGHFYSKKFMERSACCSRLHFFDRAGLTIDEVMLRPEGWHEHYIGYSVIQPVALRGCLGRTFINPTKVGHDESSFHCLTTWTKVHIGGSEFSVRGYPYISQSGEAMVCAHASLWGVCRYLSERYRVYREVYPYDLIQLTSTGYGRRVPYRSMSYADYSEILSAFGCHPALILPENTKQKDWSKDTEAFYDLYSYVESGFPVMVSFGGHVATVVGHTSKGDTGTVPEEVPGFYNSFSLVEHYIVVDDNFFPYQRLGFKTDLAHYSKQFKALKPPPSIDSIYAAVVPLAEKAYLRPADARNLAYRFLREPAVSSVLDNLLQDNSHGKEPLIARTFLTSSIAFKKRKRLCAMGQLTASPDAGSCYPVDLNLPHFVWVMEVSPLSLHAQGFAVGEVVLDATTSPDECKYIYIRIGDVLFKDEQEGEPMEATPYRYRQYTHNLGEKHG